MKTGFPVLCCRVLFLSAAFPVYASDVQVLSGGSVSLPGRAVSLVPFIRTADWKINTTPIGLRDKEDVPGAAAFILAASQVPYADCLVSATDTVSGAVRLGFGYKCRRPVSNGMLGVRLKLSAKTFKGCRWRLGDSSGVFPENKGSRGAKAEGRRMELDMPEGRRFTLVFDAPTEMQWIDNRNWGSDAFIVTFGRLSPFNVSKGDAFNISFTLSDASGKRLDLTFARRHTVKEGEDWVGIDYVKDIVPGSALDFSGFSGMAGPAGRHGWLKNAGGHFEFERLPGVRQRFYGVNLCSDANYPDAALADEMVERWTRLGYNTIRFHHHDGAWRRKKEQFDYFMHRAIVKGLYITTDLYVSRRVKWEDVGVDRKGEMPVWMYKAMCLFHEPTFRDFMSYVREFMEHVNPHTGRRYADEPGMPFISVVNEGALDGVWSRLKAEPLFAEEWRRWHAKNPKGGMLDYMTDRERVFMERFRRFWREDLKAKAMLTNQNRGPFSDALNRVKLDLYDYVDRHFYRGHPKFPLALWKLPSYVGQGNPLKDGELFLKQLSDAQVDGLPFAVSEWNCGAPSSYRALGALAFGSYAASCGWDAAWRFAYSHRAAKMREGRHEMGFFDLATDPLNQASDRAAVSLFLRQDGIEKGSSMIVDRDAGAISVSTRRTCGIYAERGDVTAGPLSCSLRDVPANVSAISLDGAPLERSGRILLLHLTDVQPDGAVYSDPTLTQLLDWGKGGCLARAGSADVRLRVAGSGRYTVHAVGTDGARKRVVPSRLCGGVLSFTAQVRQPFGGCFHYEIIRR